MKIVSRKELLTLKPGHLIAEWNDKYGVGRLMIFGGKFSENDFLTRSITTPHASGSNEMFDREIDMRENGTSYPVNPHYGRDGLFEEEQKYLVYEVADIASIVAHIAPAMRVLTPEDDE